LGSAEEEDADKGGFATGEVEDFLDVVLVFGDTAVVAATGTGKVLILEAMQGEAGLFLADLHDRLTIAFLIAGVDERVEGERVVLRGGGFFFEEGAKDAGFDGA
jgi:hypothetical protein